MTQAVATQAKKDIRTLIQSDQVKEQLAMVLPKYLTADRMARVACTAILKTPKLMTCKPESLLQGLMTCAQAGLEPDGRNAHLIPFGDQVQVIFDYKGLIALARRNGVDNIAAELVCENDEFDWWRDSDGLHMKHRVNWRKPRGDVQAAFVIWRDGDQFDGEVMPKDEIVGIRRRSKAADSGPWVTDWNEMAKKTVIRRASKRWPIASEVAEAFNSDDDRPVDITSRQVTPQRPQFLDLPPAEDGEATDPPQAETPAAPATPRRGRPPGSKNRQPVQPEPTPTEPPPQETSEPTPEPPLPISTNHDRLASMMDEIGMTFDMLLNADREAGNIVPMLQDRGSLDELSKGQVNCVIAEWDKLTGGEQ